MYEQMWRVFLSHKKKVKLKVCESSKRLSKMTNFSAFLKSVRLNKKKTSGLRIGTVEQRK